MGEEEKEYIDLPRAPVKWIALKPVQPSPVIDPTHLKYTCLAINNSAVKQDSAVASFGKRKQQSSHVAILPFFLIESLL